MARKVIINADDFGLCEGVNRAVVKACTDGALRSATIMANMPCAQEAVELAKSLHSLGAGVHLNLTEGYPLTKDGSADCLINESGKFGFTAGKLCILSALSAKVRQAVRIELGAQIQWLIDRGLRPTHLDSHKHIHSFPVIFRIVSELADKYGISAMRWPIERQRFSRGDWPRADKKGLCRSKIVSTLARINRRQTSRYFKTDEFLGIAHTGRIDVSFFRAVCLYNSAKTAEIMVHPGYTQGFNSVNTRLVEQREAELNALCNEEAMLYFEKAGIQLVHYGQL